MLKESGKSAEGLILLVPEPKLETEPMKTFEAAFVSKYGRPPHLLSRRSYDATILVGRTLNECKLDPDCAMRRLYEVKVFSGASGAFSINPDGGTTRSFIPRVVRKGGFVPK